MQEDIDELVHCHGGIASFQIPKDEAINERWFLVDSEHGLVDVTTWI